MKLMTKALLKKFPKLYANEHKAPEDIVVVAKYFTPDSSWTWYATEYDGNDLFFGFVDGHEPELGYFSLMELESVKGPFGLHIERDMWFKEGTTLADVMKQTHKEQHG